MSRRRTCDKKKIPLLVFVSFVAAFTSHFSLNLIGQSRRISYLILEFFNFTFHLKCSHNAKHFSPASASNKFLEIEKKVKHQLPSL